MYEFRNKKRSKNAKLSCKNYSLFVVTSKQIYYLVIKVTNVSSCNLKKKIKISREVNKIKIFFLPQSMLIKIVEEQMVIWYRMYRYLWRNDL